MARRKERARAWVRPANRNKQAPRSKWRWEVVYEDPAAGYKRRTKGGFTSRTAAEDWRDTESPAVKQATGQRWIDAAKGDQRFSDVAERWLDEVYVPKTRKARGYTQHRQIIAGERSLVRREFGSMRVGDITQEQVGRWLNGMVALGRSDSTIRHNFYTFRKVMRYAHGVGLIPSDPTVGFDVPKQEGVAHQQFRVYALSKAQVDALIAGMPEPWDMYVRLAAATGMRPEELCGLQLRDLEASAITVRRVVVKGKEGGLVYEEQPKTKRSRRRIVLDPGTARVLAEYVRAHRARAIRWYSDHPDHEHPGEALPLFVGVTPFERGQRQRKLGTDLDWLAFSKPDGSPNPLKHGWFTMRHWGWAQDAVGLPRTVRFYDLRHFHASWLVSRLGQPEALTIVQISERLGHESTQMTLDRYSHAQPGQDDAIAAALAAMWGASPATNVTKLHKEA